LSTQKGERTSYGRSGAGAIAAAIARKSTPSKIFARHSPK
jgi:hypothetical protein